MARTVMVRCWKAGRAAARAPLEHNPAELAEAMRTVHLDALSLRQGEALASVQAAAHAVR